MTEPKKGGPQFAGIRRMVAAGANHPGLWAVQGAPFALRDVVALLDAVEALQARVTVLESIASEARP